MLEYNNVIGCEIVCIIQTDILQLCFSNNEFYKSLLNARLKGKCNDFGLLFLLHYCIILLICLILLNYLGRYAALKLHLLASCHFISGLRVQPQNTSLEAEVNG